MEEYKESGIKNILFNKLNKEPIDIIPFIKEKNIKIVLDAYNVEQRLDNRYSQ